MKYPKVLLAAPINISKEYCLYEWLESIQKLTYPDYEILLVDNSANKAFSEKICSLGFNCLWEPPNGREARVFMADSLEKCRVAFLNGNYDFFFSLECDIFPPLNIIERLMAHNRTIAGTTFWTDHGYNCRLQLQTIYNLHTDYKNHVKEYKVRYLTFWEAQLFMDGQCKPMYGNGLGCMLISRWVLEKIVFHVEKEEVGFADSFFHRDIWEMGIDNYVDTRIIPFHKNSNWNTVLSDAYHKKMQARQGDLKIGIVK